MTEEEPRVDFHRQIVMKRVVLAELEGLEAVDDERSDRRDLVYHPGMQEDAVSAESCDMPVDGGWGDVEGTGDLTVGHAADGHHEDLGVEKRELLPVRGGESL